MNSSYDWLNSQIDRLQAGESLKPDSSREEYRPQAGEINLLALAAQFSGARPGAACPQAAFVESLRAKLRDASTGRRA